MSGAQREEFTVPQWFRVVVSVDQGRIGLVEGDDPTVVARTVVPGNGIVTAVDGGLVVSTQHASAGVDLRIQVRDEPADDALLGVHDDVVEISYDARRGSADVVTPGTERPAARAVTFPGPGPVRARVHKTVRDDPRLSLSEQYIVELWRAPWAPERVLRTAAEVAAARAAGPERVHDWVEQCSLSEAGCLTFCPGATPVEVLDAFGADPSDSAPWSRRHEAFPDLAPFIGLLPLADGVVAVEDNGWTGSETWVLEALSRSSRRAASAFWNVNGVNRLGFARDGVVLASAEWGLEAVPADLDPEVADAVAGIDYRDVHASVAKDVLAATRFTALTLGPDDLATLEARGRAYRIRGRAPSPS